MNFNIIQTIVLIKIKLFILNYRLKEGNKLQYITNLDKKKLGEYANRLITEEVILSDERLYEHILL